MANSRSNGNGKKLSETSYLQKAANVARKVYEYRVSRILLQIAVAILIRNALNGYLVSVNYDTKLAVVSDWETLDERDFPEKFFVYSAFYEYISPDPMIRVLGATVSNSRRKLYCHLFTSNRDHYETVPAVLQITRHKSRELPFCPVAILCKPSGLKIAPAFVSISPRRHFPIEVLNDVSSPPIYYSLLAKLIPVTYNRPQDSDPSLKTNFPIPIKYAACVQPTYDYDNAWQFLQWVEFQTLMGVEHFTLYNMSIGPQVSCIIDQYGKEGKMSVQNWKSIKSVPGIHNNGQVVQATDCMARYKNWAKFVVILDFDEYIIPRNNLTRDEILNYDDLMKFSLENLEFEGKFPVQFQFKSGLFGLGFPSFQGNEGESGDEAPPLLQKLSLYKHTTRLRNIKPFYYRAKFISMPDFVSEPGIHGMVHAYPENGVELLIPETIAYVHHYRECNWAADCSVKETISDTTGHVWAKKLLPNVVKRIEQMRDKCGLDL